MGLEAEASEVHRSHLPSRPRHSKFTLPRIYSILGFEWGSGKRKEGGRERVITTV